MFPWVDATIPIEQVAVLITSSRKELVGAKVLSIDELIKQTENRLAKGLPILEPLLPWSRNVSNLLYPRAVEHSYLSVVNKFRQSLGALLFAKEVSKLLGSVRIADASKNLVRPACDASDNVGPHLMDPPDLVVGTIVSGDRFISGTEGLSLQRSLRG